jgi:hypothetical protein
MRLSDLLFTLSRFLLPPAIICTLLLYFYAPLLDCTFPLAKPAVAGCSIPGQQRDAIPAETAPFRLLALADPQLEGDTSLPHPNAPLFSGIWELRRRVRDDGVVSGLTNVLGEVVYEDIPRLLKGYRKRIDLWGNDLYLAHIYRSVSWWSQPTHIVVLGDLLGSQWIGDEEFRRRSDRFWTKVFKGVGKVPQSITESSGRVEVLGENESWSHRIIAVAGNHDIGYAGDIDSRRIERFEEAFGSVNWGITFRLHNASTSKASPIRNDLLARGPSTPELRLLILNSMNLDSPAKDLAPQQQSRDFALSELSQASTSPASGTVLLTHIPFHKEAGVCVDGTFFDWFPEGGIKEQNHLSKETSHFLLDSLIGIPHDSTNAGNAIVLNGHDHEGCDTYHYRTHHGDAGQDASDKEMQEDTSTWQARHYSHAQHDISDESRIGLREITVRSMMGSFSGNAGFLSAWFDNTTNEGVGEWKFEYASCMLGVQHIWWGVHVLDLIVVALGLGGVGAMVIEEVEAAKAARGEGKEGKGKVKTS